MESTDESDETSFWLDNDLEDNRTHLPYSISVSGIHRAVLESDFHKVKRYLEAGDSVNKKEPYYDFTSLHLAVMYNDVEMVDYLLTKEGIEVDARCSKGRTPLCLAATVGHDKCVEKLIRSGSDINVADNDNNTALHMSVYYPHICQFLLERGARISTNSSGNNTLHAAIINDCLEIVYMLLYYNVDANVPDSFGRTPFMTALVYGNEKAQEDLFEYVDDFNRFNYDPVWGGSTLDFALESNSPFVKDIIERGADVNYGDDPSVEDGVGVFSACLCYPVDLSTFKMVWEKLRYNDSKNTIDLISFLDYIDEVPTFLQVIIESDNMGIAVQFFSKGENYFLFVNKFAEGKFRLNQLTLLTCRLLEYGFRASSYDVHTVFSHYGYCELFRILLYMDNDLSRGWLLHMALPRLMFDVNYDLQSIVTQVKDIPKNTMLQLLENSVCPPLIDALNLQYSDDQSMIAILGGLPRVPSLIELARNAARKHIWQSFKITNTCQFYTIIDHLDVPVIYKNILTFKKTIYVVK